MCLAAQGAKVAVLDINADQARKVAAEIGGVACPCDITDSASLQAAIDQAAAAHGPARILMSIAGIGTAKRVVGKDGQAAPLEDFVRVIQVNLIGTYNASRLFAAACAKLDPLPEGERGVMVFTASVAAFDGQVGQQAYSASKAGVAGMTLPMARDLAQHGIRVCTIAPGLFATPLLQRPLSLTILAAAALILNNCSLLKIAPALSSSALRSNKKSRVSDVPTWLPSSGCNAYRKV